MSAAVTLTKGYEAIVDLIDIDKVMTRPWVAHIDYIGRKPFGYYRIRARGVINRKHTYLHTFIMGNKEGLEIDHKDGDTLNYRRANMEFVTHQENCVRRRYRHWGNRNRQELIEHERSKG
jgi:hypothetical protein